MIIELTQAYCKKYTYIPERFVDTIYHNLIAPVANSVEVSYGDARFKLNIYTLLVAPSRTGKGKVINEITKEILLNVNHGLVLSDEGTAEAYIKQLGNSEKLNESNFMNEIKYKGAGIICNDEITSIIKPTADYTKSMIEFLTGIYNAQSKYVKSLVNEKFTINEPHVNLFTGTQLQKISELSQTNIFSGFFPRLNIVKVDERPMPTEEQIVAPIKYSEEMKTVRQTLERLTALLDEFNSSIVNVLYIPISANAMKYIYTWDYNKLRNTLSTAETIYLNTRREFAIKYAGIFKINKALKDTIRFILQQPENEKISIQSVNIALDKVKDDTVWKKASEHFYRNLVSELDESYVIQSTNYLDAIEKDALEVICTIMGTADEKKLALVKNAIHRILARNLENEVFKFNDKHFVTLRALQRSTGIMVKTLLPIIEGLKEEGVVETVTTIQQKNRNVRVIEISN